MDKLSFDQWLAIAAVFGSAVSLIWGIVHFMVQRSLLKAKMLYEGEELLRRNQLEISRRIFQCVGRMCEPRTEEEFDDTWYDLAELWQGEVYLLNDKGFQTAFNAFCDHFWEFDEYDAWSEHMKKDSELDALLDLAQKVGSSLNAYIRREFARTGTIKFEDKKKKKIKS